MPSIDLVRFTNSGTEGNVMALAGARVFAQRKGRKAATVMVFHGGYHGGVLYFVSRRPTRQHAVRLVVGALQRHRGHPRAAAQHPGVFAVLVEPMQGSHGCLPGDPASSTCCARRPGHDITLIFDEVMTSRLSPGGLQAKLGVIPDMTTLGKYIGGGMSFGAFGGKREIMELFDPPSPTPAACGDLQQ